MVTQAATGASSTIAALTAHDVEYLFGIPGVHTLLPYDLLHDHPTIRPIVTRHEAGAGFAAIGYARATGRPAAVLVVPGPGATNLATAALVAKSDGVPLVLITAAVPEALQGRYAIHEADLAAFMCPLVKAQITAGSTGQIGPALAAAFQLAAAEPPGPVHVLIPYNLFGMPVDHETDTPLGWPIPCSAETAREPDEAALNEAFALLLGSRAPLIYAGHGVVRARAGGALVAVAELLNAPVMTSNKARGVIPEDHPLAVGIPSMAGAADLARRADVCLALGTHFNEYTTLTWKTPLPARMIRVDRDPAALDLNYPAAVRLQGDVGFVLEWLRERLPEPHRANPPPADVAGLRARRAAALHAFLIEHNEASPPFHPRFVTRALRVAFPPDTVFTSDGSATESWLYEPPFVITQPDSLLVPEVQQTMGYAVATALGAALGAPGRRVVAVTGDGSLAMALGELATIAAHRLPITIVVFNDGQYNALRVRQEAMFDRRYVGTDIGAVDFALIATGMGLAGVRITSGAQLRDTLRSAGERTGPLLIDVPIAPEPLSERYTAVVEAGG